jgi:pyruvoyl-dependent arginine decarboxylase (PvlArgDC)
MGAFSLINCVEQINQSKYLGCTISSSVTENFNTKLSKFNHIYETIKKVLNKKTRRETQIQSCKTMDIPTLTYSSDTRTLTERQRQKIEIAE